jgi:2-keto-3-deoxy-L-rhamnonate aldolase RhmA
LLEPSPFQDRLRRREALLGTLLTLPSPEVAELLGGSGLDWLFVDMEHGLLDLQAVQRLLQAAKPCPCLVRVPSNEPSWIGKALDAGATGLIFPHIATAAEARAVVSAARYPPEGTRSIGAARAQGYGRTLAHAVANANAETLRVVQVEHIEGVRNIEAILDVPGVDAVFLGPFDLSASLGRPGEVQHPDVQEALRTVREACTRRGLPCGIFVVGVEATQQAVAEGYSLVCSATDLIHFNGAVERLLKEVKG